jgi:hypothetical protein
MNPKLGFLHPVEMGISLAAVFFPVLTRLKNKKSGNQSLCSNNFTGLYITCRLELVPTVCL